MPQDGRGEYGHASDYMLKRETESQRESLHIHIHMHTELDTPAIPHGYALCAEAHRQAYGLTRRQQAMVAVVLPEKVLTCAFAFASVQVRLCVCVCVCVCVCDANCVLASTPPHTHTRTHAL